MTDFTFWHGHYLVRHAASTLCHYTLTAILFALTINTLFHLLN